ncbi:unnamed protein product, partial [Musa hybrid cultivar]
KKTPQFHILKAKNDESHHPIGSCVGTTPIHIVRAHQDINQRRVISMIRRRAATKEYLTAARRIATEMTKSWKRTWTLAQVRRPVNATAAMFSGSGDRRSRHRRLKAGRWRSLPRSTPPPPSSSCFSPFLPSAATRKRALRALASPFGRRSRRTRRDVGLLYTATRTWPGMGRRREGKSDEAEAMPRHRRRRSRVMDV